ncbi:hypothetical protein ACTNEF_17110, partial [Bariatricus sp. HCP28S3_E4]|uniref:hypothetical protein n=1 Tax=unclassified Bariatricus TaxID=2677046 RepID=UPI003F89F45A
NTSRKRSKKTTLNTNAYNAIYVSMLESDPSNDLRSGYLTSRARSISFASQMIPQITNRSYGSKLPRTALNQQNRFRHPLVMLERAQGGCLGTKSR